MDYAKMEFYPRMHVANTIEICEIQRGTTWGFVIYGSGLTRSGKIAVRQGIHQALRNLVDYSIIQLLGMYYDLPVWRIFGSNNQESDAKFLEEWRQNFWQQDLPAKIERVQKLLTKYDLAPLYVEGKLIYQFPVDEYGQFGRVTNALALKFLYQYAPQSRLVSSLENPTSSFTPEHLAELYLLLIKNITI